MYDLIVIGAGPAGLTAALYAARAGKNVLVLERKVPGGQIVNAKIVHNYPGILEISGNEFSNNLLEQAKKYGAQVEYEQVVGIIDGDLKTVKTEDDEYLAKAVIIATGADNRKLGLPKEDKLVGRGISYCATCDGNFFKGKNVAVVGGGNTALQDAIYLANLANTVFLIHRRDSFRGEKAYVDELRQIRNVEFVLEASVTEIIGDEKVEGIVVKNGNGEERKIDVNGVFVAVGNAPQNEVFKDVVELDEKGYIKSEDGVHTNVKGVYVAGDARAKELNQLTTAVSDGSIAATVAMKEME